MRDEYLKNVREEHRKFMGKISVWSPKALISNAREIAVKQDILYLLENDINEEQLKKIKDYEDIIDVIYFEWDVTETGYEDSLHKVTRELIEILF